MSHLLGIDIGTSSTKTLLCDERGGVAATATADHAPPHGAGPGWSEQDPRDWWRAAGEATQAVLQKASIDARQIKGIGLSGQMHGSVCLDARDEVIRPAILWNDQRTASQCTEIEKRAGGRSALIQQVGNPALTGFTAPKILWLRDNEPAHYEQTQQLLLPKDYVRFRMTGDFATDVGDASGTLLFDVEHRRWNSQMLESLGLDPTLLPRSHESHEPCGRVTQAGAEALGVAEGTPVVAGSGDQPAGAVGNGIVDEGVVSATLGTSGVVFAHAGRPTYDPQGRVHTMCGAVAGQWCVFGCMLSAGGALQWLRNHLGQSEIEQAKRAGRDPYELLIDQAAEAPAGCDGLFFLPYLTGERCPHPDPAARGGWIGLTARHDRAALIRSLIEGVTFGMADVLQVLDGMGLSIERVRLSGGGARSPFWRQLQADVYDKRVAVINANEGPAYGAAILAGVGTGVWNSVPEACEAIISETESRSPNVAQRDLYAAQHRQYQRLYQALKDEFAQIAGLNKQAKGTGT